jgi:hypothetical protein
MKLRMFAVLVVLFFCLPGALADEINFSWDYDDAIEIDGFRIYAGPRREGDNGEWYNDYHPDPIATVDPEARTATADEPGIVDDSRNICFVVRAYRGDEESDDSNYVCQVIDNTPLQAPTALTGNYDPEQNVITLTWDQADADRAKFWLVYYKLPDSDFVELGRVDNTGQSDVTLSSVFDAVAEGLSADVTFAVVAYKNFDVFSPNSDELTITIDRSKPPAPVDFKITVEIPVQ